jgi:glycosyltransferase involved in cell wall biosynthesis
MNETYPPTSVILPTVEWRRSCQELLDQIGDEDELLIVCDTHDDPIADRDLPSGATLIVAGEPVACSGKANAVAAGMEAASNDRIVWTDDDFFHPPDWLETLHAEYDSHGPVSEIPFFVGRDGLAKLLEPIYAVGGSLTPLLEGQSWAGGLLFDRSDVDTERLIAELRRTVSDDGLLSEHIDFTVVRRVRRVAIGGTLRATLERHTRFSQLVWNYDALNMIGLLVVSTIVAAFCVLSPPLSALLLTGLYGGVYAYLGVRRWTFLLAYPAALVQIPLFLYGLWRDTFVWGGRRYRWRSKFDVEVLDR